VLPVNTGGEGGCAIAVSVSALIRGMGDSLLIRRDQHDFGVILGVPTEKIAAESHPTVKSFPRIHFEVFSAQLPGLGQDSLLLPFAKDTRKCRLNW